MLQVLFAAAEAAPFAKTGGLGDVIGSLPKALRKKGVDVRVMLPKYKTIPEAYRKKTAPLCALTVPLAWRRQYCGIEVLEHEGVTYYFLDNEYYFNRDRLYGYFDEAERFAFFCRAVLESIDFIGFRPQIIHCHDWHTGMIPVIWEEFYRHRPSYQKIKTFFTVHNLKYQGTFSHWILHNILGLPDKYYTYEKLEFYDQVSFMKAGLVFANQLTTVSPSYAEEIKDPYFGERLDDVLRDKAGKLQGILNGLDYDSYNPLTDPCLDFTYDEKNAAWGKAANKTRLQEEAGLEADREKPLLAMVSRLVEQKGLDLLLRILEELLNAEDLQLVIVGEGEPHYERALGEIISRHPDKARLYLGFDERLARRVYAAADLFLMPSLFEPCGLSQLIALRYGSLPVARETGGLKDTVFSYREDTGTGNGFTFTNYNAHDFLYTLRRALAFYRKPQVWSGLVRNAMASDYGWERSAEAYEALYSRWGEGE